MKITIWTTALSLTTLLISGAAQAQDDTEAGDFEAGETEEAERDEAEESTAEENEAGEQGEGGEAAESSDADEADDARAESAVELPGVTYHFIGARYRGIIVPQFMQNLFADGGDTVYVHAFGPEFVLRKDGFEYNLGLWFGLYHQDPTAYKGKSDEQIAWETIESKLNILYFTSDFLWSHEFNPKFALNYGVGAGFGIVFGDLKRNQTYPGPESDVDDPNTWQKCNAPFDPDATYCDDDNEHYGNYTEPSWAGGGSKPIVFPWLAAQTGLRYKASRRFVGRLDLGFGTSGFFFGLGADYGI